MRVTAGSSLFLATLASSSSIANLVAAAPTDGGDSPATAAAIPANAASVPGVPDLGSIVPGLGGAGLPSVREYLHMYLTPIIDTLSSIAGMRRDELDTRQLGIVFDTVANLLPLLDTVLGLLGLKRSSTVSAAAFPPLPQDQVEMLKGALEKLMGPLPLPIPLPLPNNDVPGAPNGSTAPNNPTSPSNAADKGKKTKRAALFSHFFSKKDEPSGCPATGDYDSEAANPPVAPPGTNAPGGTAPASPAPLPGLPINLPGLPVNPPNLPVSPPNLPVSPPNLPVSPPNLPVSPPNLPVSPPNLPVSPPVSPSLPPNPPNSPAGAAPGTPPALPPLFAAAGFNYASGSATSN